MLFDIFIKPGELKPLPYSTDMHCHIVPGVDDGAPDVETSLRLLEHMSEWGLKRIYASPHSTQDVYENTPQSLAAPFGELESAAKAAGLQTELHHHMEYRIDEFFLRQFDAQNIITLPGKFILIENSFSHEPWGLNTIIHELTNRDYNPILAHPERYAYYAQRHRERYHNLHDIGTFFQVNLLSLAGYYGKMEREAAVYLLKNNMAQFIGTDLHHMSHVESINRYLRSKRYQHDLPLFENTRNDSL